MAKTAEICQALDGEFRRVCAGKDLDPKRVKEIVKRAMAGTGLTIEEFLDELAGFAEKLDEIFDSLVST